MRVYMHRAWVFNYLDLSLCSFLSSWGLCISGSPIRMSRIFFTPLVQPDNPFVRLNRDPDTRFVAVTTEIRKIMPSLWYCRVQYGVVRSNSKIYYAKNFISQKLVLIRSAKSFNKMKDIEILLISLCIL